MDYIEFENKKALLVSVEAENHKEQDDLKMLILKSGSCLKNSYDVAKIQKCKMVEGFVVTRFKSKPIECVGHVWNEIDGKYIDYTICLKQHNEQVVSHNYYLVKSYDFTEKKTEMKRAVNQSNQIFTNFLQPLEEHIIFKTKVQEKELEVLQLLRELDTDSKE